MIYIKDHHHKHMTRTSHYSFYYNTIDFRRTNSMIFLGVMILIVVVLIC